MAIPYGSPRLDSGYFSVKSYTNTSVTFYYTVSRFVIIIGKKN